MKFSAKAASWRLSKILTIEIIFCAGLVVFPTIARGGVLEDFLHRFPLSGQNLLVKNGFRLMPQEFPEAVVIDLQQRGKPYGICSGIALSPTVVLSAAHCVANGVQPVRVSVTPNLSNALSLGGQPYRRLPSKEGPPIQSVAVANFESMNARAVDAGLLQGVDLLLIYLKAPLQFLSTPPLLYKLDNVAAAKYVRVVGYGQDGKKGFGTRLMADVDVAVPRCNPTASAGVEALCARGAELFAKRPDGKFDTCPGDSGGPVFVRNRDGRYSLIGITSRAPVESAKCGGGTFVTLLDGNRLQWIQSRIPIPAPTVELDPVPPEALPPSQRG